jgi:hypothetical protein
MTIEKYVSSWNMLLYPLSWKEVKRKKTQKWECGDEGRIGNYRPKKAKQSHKWDYFIVHEQIEGFWGKNSKVKKRRRCYMKTEQQRSQILERLGRYRL